MIREELVTLVELTLYETAIIRKLRLLQTGSITLHKFDGRISLVEQVEKVKVDKIPEEELLASAEKIGQKTYTIPVIEKNGVTDPRQSPAI